MSVLGGNANRRSAITVALVHVAAIDRSIEIFIGQNGVSRKTTLLLHATLYLVLGFRHLSNVESTNRISRME